MEKVRVEVRVAPADCWACGAETEIVSSVALSRRDAAVECSISDFTDYPALIGPIQASLRGTGQVGPLKPRFSKTVSRSYMSNGCAHCDALFGQHFEIQTRYQERALASFVGAEAGWGTMMDALLASEDGHLFR